MFRACKMVDALMSADARTGNQKSPAPDVIAEKIAVNGNAPRPAPAQATAGDSSDQSDIDALFN